jgi:hypothetical protein
MRNERKARAGSGPFPWSLILAPAGDTPPAGHEGGGHSPKLCADPSCDRLACMAYKSGWRDGYAAGYAAGYTAGYAAGYAAGYTAGSAAGR